MSMYCKTLSTALASLCVAWLSTAVDAQVQQAPPISSERQGDQQRDASQDADRPNRQQQDRQANQADRQDNVDAQSGRQGAQQQQLPAQDYSGADAQRSDRSLDAQSPTDARRDVSPLDDRGAQYGDQSQRTGQQGQSETPPVPEQARTSGQDADPDADWRMTFHNGEWWFYSADGDWMYHRGGDWQPYQQGEFQRLGGQDMQTFGLADDRQQQVDRTAQLDRQQPEQQNAQVQDQQFRDDQYTTGYRGAQQQQAQPQSGDSGQRQAQRSSGATTPLYFDNCGRPYICENGRRLYVRLQPQQPHSVGYRGTGDQQATTSGAQGQFAEQQQTRSFAEQQSGSVEQQRMQEQDQYRSAQRQAPPVFDDRSPSDQSSARDMNRQPQQAAPESERSDAGSASDQQSGQRQADQPSADSAEETQSDANRDSESDNDSQSDQI